MNRRFLLTGGAAAMALTACGTAEPVWAPDELVNSVRFRDPGPKRLSLLTMFNVGTNNGAHTSLLINASERVLWDPAGTFKHPSIPERNDVIFGVNQQILDVYISYHSRVTYYTLVQELDVEPGIAEQAFREVQAYGAVPKANCTIATCRILNRLPGVGPFSVSFFPDKLAEQFGRKPGVREWTHYENDSDDKSVAAAQFDALLSKPQP